MAISTSGVSSPPLTMVAAGGAIPPSPPHHSPSTAQLLPPEVVDSIASQLVKASDMASAACACRAWRGPSQRRVFQNVRFDSNQAAYAFLHCGSSQRDLVKELHLYAEGMERDMVASAHYKIIGRMQGIGTLYASGLDLVLDDRMPDAFKNLPKLVLFGEVKLRYGNGRAPYIFPRLERLSLMQLESFAFVPFRRGDRSSLARYMQTPVLRHLELGAGSGVNKIEREFLQRFRRSPFMSANETRRAFLQELFADNGARLISIFYANKCMDHRMLGDMNTRATRGPSAGPHSNLSYPRIVYDAHGGATDYVKEAPSAPVRFFPGTEGVSLADLCKRKNIALNITVI